MIIETKFKPGDKVYAICSRYEDQSLNAPCPTCNGMGKVSMFGLSLPCRSVFGADIKCKNGNLVSLRKTWRVRSYPIFIDLVSIKINDYETSVLYEEIGSEESDYIEESFCFSTKEEAQTECDRRNNEIP